MLIRFHLIPEDSETGEPEDGYKFRGHFLYFTNARVCVNRSRTLTSFGLRSVRDQVPQRQYRRTRYHHTGRQLTTTGIDVAGLPPRWLSSYSKSTTGSTYRPRRRRHTPASLGKAHLRKMGIAPVLERQPDFPKYYLGAAETQFRRADERPYPEVRVLVVYTDFLSMYPTVNVLMGLWKFVVAEESIAQAEVSRIDGFDPRLRRKNCSNPKTWPELPAFVRVVPDADVLPTRAKYSWSPTITKWPRTICPSKVRRRRTVSGMRFQTLPRPCCSTGRVPNIVEAFQIVPHGVLPSLVRLRCAEAVDVHPGTQVLLQDGH